MSRKVDEEEKLVHTLCVGGQNRQATFLTEDGLYLVAQFSATRLQYSTVMNFMTFTTLMKIFKTEISVLTHMLDKIDKINQVLLDRKIGSVDFWIESSYIAGNGEMLVIGYSNQKCAVRRHCKGVVKHDVLTERGNQ